MESFRKVFSVKTKFNLTRKHWGIENEAKLLKAKALSQIKINSGACGERVGQNFAFGNGEEWKEWRGARSLKSR